MRLSHTYGPGMELNDGRVFADFVANIVEGRDIVLKSDGSARRPFCYLADATVAYFRVLLLGGGGEAYNVGSGMQCSVLELAETLCRLFPEQGCKVVRQVREAGDRYYALPCAGIRAGFVEDTGAGVGGNDGDRRGVQEDGGELPVIPGGSEFCRESSRTRGYTPYLSFLLPFLGIL